MKIALVGAELEENLGLRYMTSTLEREKHRVEIVPFNTEQDISQTVKQVISFSPQVTGLSMVFTSRAREFCRLAQALRDGDYGGHIVAGGPFASFNCERLLQDFPAFDSIALGEGEELISTLVNHLDDLSQVPGLCYRKSDGSIATNPSLGNPRDLDGLAFPKRITFHEYYGKSIASILSSRGCWRNCAFCSINAWYERVGGRKFRFRSVDSIAAEMKELYFQHGIRIFNFQDDNFFLPNQTDALERFKELREQLQHDGVREIAIAIKARPDSITYDSIKVLDDLGLFRVFLGVENASEEGLHNLNRKQTLEQILHALRVLNDFDVHVAYNLLMFEPDTTMDNILTNLRFIERHVENPFNFCRAEAYAGTGLEAKLKAEGRLLGDYFGFDYRLRDPKVEAFHQIANYAFFDRNFNDFGLHYFNMQVDFCFQLLRRFYPVALSQTLRGATRNFIKETNIDTYQHLCRIYDFVDEVQVDDQLAIQGFAREMRQNIDEKSMELHVEGERILEWLEEAYSGKRTDMSRMTPHIRTPSLFDCGLTPYYGFEGVRSWQPTLRITEEPGEMRSLKIPSSPIPYDLFKARLRQQGGENE